MPTATRILRERVVLVFDFDGTLAPSTTPVLAEAASLDHERISKQVDDMQREDHWQYALAKAEIFRRLGADGANVTRQLMEQVGKDYEGFPGAEDFAKRLRKYARELDREVDLEFVMLTAGFGAIPRATKIAEQFDRIYSGELHFSEEGYVLGAKRIITHADKVLYIRQLAEGIDVHKPSELEDAFVEHRAEDYYVPLSQVVYIGDGASDLSAFQVVEEHGGVGIAIDKPDQEWDNYGDVSRGRRVHNLAPPDYTEGSELMQSLESAVASMIHRIKILRFGEGE